MKRCFAAILIALVFTSCSENYSIGERIGLVTQFSRSGIMYKSYEGHLNLTQTGMNSSQPFDFSIDNDIETLESMKRNIEILDSAATFGWKVKIKYHETFGKNWFANRGETDHFVTNVEILDKKPMSVFNGKDSVVHGKAIDTIFVMIVPKEKVIK